MQHYIYLLILYPLKLNFKKLIFHFDIFKFKKNKHVLDTLIFGTGHFKII